jgi:hypothetical protein
MTGPSYRAGVTITRKIVLDEEGNPSEVLIPYAQFVGFQVQRVDARPC